MKARYHYTKVVLVMALCAMTLSVCAKTEGDSILQRLFIYPYIVKQGDIKDSISYSYLKCSTLVNRRNTLLMAVPTMYAVAHGGASQYLREDFNKTIIHGPGNYTSTKLMSLSTVPHRSTPLPNMLQYLTPNIYHTTMIGDYILSPFNKDNRHLYRYKLETFKSGNVRLTFRPKLNNTLLVKGSAQIDPSSGRIYSTELHGEYDMIKFHLYVQMGDDGYMSLLPQRCELSSIFKLFGNDIRYAYTAVYGLSKTVEGDITDTHDLAIMSRLRPEPLTTYEQMIYDRYLRKLNQKKEEEVRDSLKQASATAGTIINTKHKLRAKKILWDMLGENLLTHIKQNFGTEQQGYVKIAPILNPLYMGYNENIGFYYKFDIRGGYNFSTRKNIWLRFKAGYSFKLHQFFFQTPLTYTFSKKHNGYIHSQFAMGRRITNSRIVNELMESKEDAGKPQTTSTTTNEYDELHLNKFRDMYWDCYLNYDINPYLGFQSGFIFHRRSGTDHKGFKLLGIPRIYISWAPKIELLYRPMGYHGPTLMASYERSFKDVARTNMPYARWEFDGQYVMPLKHLNYLSIRIGTGFYTMKDKNGYFVDYENFRQTTIPDGWNDKWSGEFELLDGDTYNTSSYYVRANLTYESPILALAWMPFVGHYIEKERLYLSFLDVKKTHPYIEVGYGVKTRALSVGAFVSTINGKYKEFGFKFGFELFRQW